jgi:hypothetical protein
MGDYYSNSLFTLSALSASNNKGGMLAKREPEAMACISAERNLYTRRYQTLKSWGSTFDTAPLCQRAWVLQERLLSTRILHYGSSEIFWECHTCSLRERSELKHTLTKSITLSSVDSIDFKRFLFDPNLTSLTPAKLFNMWRNIVTHYSRRSLTRETDKLPALSGLAAIFQRSQNLTYMAGLWREDANSLLWQIDGFMRTADENLKPKILSRAPSWSWASVGFGRCMKWDESNYIGEGHESQSADRCHVRAINVEALGADPMGEVKPGGEITLWAKTWPVHWQLRPNDKEYGNYPMNCIVPHVGSAVLDTVDLRTEDDTVPSKEYKGLYINGKAFLLIMKAKKNGAWRRIGIGKCDDRFKGELKIIAFEEIVLI